MSDTGGLARRTRRYSANRIVGIAAASLLLILVTAKGAGAQFITFGGSSGGVSALCSVSGTVAISDGDDCSGLQNPSTILTIGPSGSQIIFNANTGAAEFNGSVNMNGVRVQNVGTPTFGTDATNMNYVDGLHNGQQTQINDIVVVNNQQNTRLTNVETVNTQQDTRLTGVETVNTQQDTRLTTLEGGFAGQAEQIATINQNIRSLTKRDGELADGIAISLALAQPAFQPGQRFAIRGGWGNFDGSNALGVSAAGLLHTFRGGGSVILDVGVGASMRYNMFAGRGGVTLGW